MLSAFLFLVGMGTLYIWRGNKYLYLYIIVAILGPAAEIAAIKAGAWSYSNPDFLGIPYWLPFIWGEAAIYINSLIVRLKEVK